jgi:uncharacterized protein
LGVGGWWEEFFTTLLVSIKDRGFAHMAPEKRRAIARMGGVAAHAKGVAHVWNAETARNAGREGAKVRRERRGDRPRDPSE